jgi:hypothetical protein
LARRSSLASTAISLSEVIALRLGHHFDCWALRDTDRFYKLPKAWLDTITDNQGILVGGLEAETYSKVLTRANYTSLAAFARVAREDLTYAHLFNEPDEYRGQVVRITGRLKRINRFSPPREAAENGVIDLYEAWIFSEMLGTGPYCVVFTEWPADLPRSLLGERIKGDYTVRVDGYFFKKFRYTAADGKNTQRDAPLLIAHSLVVVGRAPSADETSDHWLGWLSTLIVALFGGVLATVVGLTWWFRRTDNRIRQRILSKSPEFVLPPPDALPVAPPVVPPAKPVNGPTRSTLPPPRITFPGGQGPRVGEPPSSPEGGTRGSPDKPPDEGAGV